MEKKLISVVEASKIFGIGRTKLYHLSKTDPSMPVIRIGSVTRINRDMMDQWIDEASKAGKLL